MNQEDKSKIPELAGRHKIIYNQLVPGENLLDIGCGQGDLTSNAKKKFKNVYGLDYNEECVNNSNSKGIITQQADLDKIDHLPFEKEFFDSIVCMELIEHLVNFQNFFPMVSEVMKKNGTLYLTCPNAGWWRYRMNVLFGRPFYTGSPKLNPIRGFSLEHVRFYNMADIKNLSSPYFKLEKMIAVNSGAEFKGFTPFISKIRKSLAERLLFVLKKK
jgi:2-polyprenyl-3-methyl-5-hydroxy-6-metoxy-1,4-benzoquinol methylase